MSREDLNFCKNCGMFFPSSLQAFQHPCPGRARGTPKSMEEATRNGLEEWSMKYFGLGSIYLSAPIIWKHYRDKLAQCFTPDLMDDPKVQTLWTRITGEDWPAKWEKAHRKKEK